MSESAGVMLEPIALGTTVAPWGKIAAVGIRDGERYYMLKDKHGDVALMPASVVEGRASKRSKG